MKTGRSRLAVLAGVIAAGGVMLVVLAGQSRKPPLPVLSFRIGQPFGEVVRNSSYPVLKHEAGNPGQREDGFGWTDISEPVILCFNDPVNGFILPPTKFAAVTYLAGNVGTVATTPMLEKQPFDKAVAVLENLQEQFRAGGWEPYSGDGSKWFDLTAEGKKRLHARMFDPGFSQEATLRVPNKYGMTFRLKCAEGCSTHEPPYLFLIDLGIGGDTEGWKPGQPMVWEKPHPDRRVPVGRGRPNASCRIDAGQ